MKNKTMDKRGKTETFFSTESTLMNINYKFSDISTWPITNHQM